MASDGFSFARDPMLAMVAALDAKPPASLRAASRFAHERTQGDMTHGIDRHHDHRQQPQLAQC
jgi:hypothetical protein